MGLDLHLLFYHETGHKTEDYIFEYIEWLEKLVNKHYENKHSCDHIIVDARNEVIQSGYVCIKCFEPFAAGDHNGDTNKAGR